MALKKFINYFHLNGQLPNVTTTAERRAVDPALLTEDVFPEYHAREQELLGSGFTWVDEYFTSSRGLSLSTRTLLPPSEPEGHNENSDYGILYCHGYTDHLRLLAKGIIISYAERGFLVTGMELEGHGWSDHINGFLPDVKPASEDLYEFFRRQQEKYPKKKWFVHGQSFGGMFALLTALKSSERKDVQVDGLILSAPMCKINDEVKPPKYMIDGLHLLARIVPTWSVVPSKMHSRIVYKDPKIVERTLKDPIKYVGRPRLGTAAAMIFATVELEENLDKIKTPFFVLHGKKDVVTTYQASVDLYEKSVLVDEADKKLLLIDEAWHGILSAEPEEDRKFYWQEIFNWIRTRCDKS